MAAPCPGIFFTGLSAEKHYVKVDFNPGSLIIRGDRVDEVWNTGEYVFESPNGHTFILEKAGRQLIFTRNTIEAYFHNNPLKDHYKFFFKVSRWRPYAIGIVSILIAGYFISLKVSDYFLSQFTIEEQRKAFSFMDHGYLTKNCMSEEAREVVNLILKETGHSDAIGQVYFNYSSEVNAFALPSGSIVFTSSFLKQMQSVEEFVAVLFHEIGHIKHRHHLKRLRNTVGLNIVSILVFGENTGVRDALSNYILNQYTSSQEEESDAYARLKLDQYGISRIGAIDFFERNKDKEGLAIFSTHPSSNKRIEFFQSEIPRENQIDYHPDKLNLLKSCTNGQ